MNVYQAERFRALINKQKPSLMYARSTKPNLGAIVDNWVPPPPEFRRPIYTLEVGV